MPASTCRLAVLVCLFLSTLCNAKAAREIHVSPKGIDSAEGTREAPLATLTGARDLARRWRSAATGKESIVIVVQPGMYFLKEPLVLEPRDSGTAEAPLVFRGDKGGTPIIVGGRRVLNFTKVNEKLWEAKVPEGLRFEQLYVNGRRAVRARTPNAGFSKHRGVSETVVEPPSYPGGPAKSALQHVALGNDTAAQLAQIPPADLSQCVVNFHHKWNVTRRYITAFDPASAVMDVKGEGMKSWVSLKDSRFFLENSKVFLDMPGEWFLDAEGTISYVPMPGENMERAEFLAPTLERLVTIQGQRGGPRTSNIMFENLSFQVAAYNLPPQGLDPQQTSVPVEAAVQIDNARNIAFRGCEIAHTGGAGIWFRRDCVNGLVEHCYLHDLGGSGVKIGYVDTADALTQRVFVNNNVIHSGGRVTANSPGVVSYHGSEIAITHNDIADFRYSGVSTGWVWGYRESPSHSNTVKYNHIHHLGWGQLSDMGAIYNVGISAGSVFSHNVIHHVDISDYGGWGIYLDEGSSGLVIENNLIYACENGGFHQHYGKDNLVRNNIIARNVKGQVHATKKEGHPGFTFTNNIVYWDQGLLCMYNWQYANFNSAQNCYFFTGGEFKVGRTSWENWISTGRDQGSIIADPGFVDPQANDFRLRSEEVTKRINFTPFDHSKAGVYGSDEWKATAKLPEELEKKFGKSL